ncbi:D-alanyl-D-alanine carboxypeptidase/D-alanyl-D-alanine-endopeptidase [Actinacidiphila oryziradicis]|uniref:D-alanyl-D-alanine carboxypeptidase/D-alanyl-D-alanine-endopeptidase n=2 Tax=Actinacidiphila oryziradicis TaxID=2571141 RepID=A0A4V5MX05_9ACTN|nr:D-alanyl-D-alanine carboxypeptidase/D-alanyl-D-alanine-endopeptidase [Actinacidiphila oryziradicis]
MSLTAVAVAGPWESGQRTAERVTAASRDARLAAGAGKARGSGRRGASAPVPSPSVEDVLVGLDTSPPGAATAAGTPLPTTQGLTKALGPLLKASTGLGRLRTAAVIDASTGKALYGSRAGDAAVPASTTKIATAVAALSLLGPDHRFTTAVEADGDHRIVLVGGGDPTLTARKAAGGGYDAASLRTLADDTARALKKAGTTKVALAYDTSLYSGTALHPIGRNDNLAPVTALMTDEGRLDDTSYKGPAARVQDPAGAAAGTFADLLRDRGIDVTGDPVSGRAPAGATPASHLAEVRSVPLSALVERMLTNSDNDIAEALARQAAIAAGRPASFAGGAAAVRSALGALGVPLSGARFTDGSGLSQQDALSASQLAGLLVLAASPAHPDLRSILTGLPIGGFTGSLSTRFTFASGATGRLGAGLIRAKTGTLTGVNALAGTVVDADGRLLVFAFLTKGTTDPAAAQDALDHLAATVAACGCG